MGFKQIMQNMGRRLQKGGKIWGKEKGPTVSPFGYGPDVNIYVSKQPLQRTCRKVATTTNFQ